MMVYRVRFPRTAGRSFSALPQEVRIRIGVALERYATDPFRRHDVRKVRGCPADTARYRMRIGEYRLIFRILQEHLSVGSVAVGKKKNMGY